MKNTASPRTALIGGFRKDDVLAYVEQISVGYQNEIAALKKQMSDAKAERDRAVAECKAAKEISSETERLRNGLRISYDEITDTKTALEAARGEITSLKDELASEKNALAETRDALAAEKASLEDAKAEAERLLEKISALENNVAAKTAELDRNAAALSAARAFAATLRETAQQLESAATV